MPSLDEAAARQLVRRAIADRFAIDAAFAQGDIRRCRRNCRSGPTGSSRLPTASRRTAAGRASTLGPHPRRRDHRSAAVRVHSRRLGTRRAKRADHRDGRAGSRRADRGRDGDRGDDCRHRVVEPASIFGAALSGGFRSVPESLSGLADQQLPRVAGLAVDIAAAAAPARRVARLERGRPPGGGGCAGAHRWSRADVVGGRSAGADGSRSRSASRSGRRPPAQSSSARCAGSGPLWPSYAGAAAFVPLLSAATTPVAALILRITILMLMVATANRMSDGWTRRRVLTGALLVVVGGVLGNAGSPLNLAAVDCVGRDHRRAVAGGLRRRAPASQQHRAVRRGALDHRRAPFERDGRGPIPGVLAGALIACVVMWVVAIAWFRALDRLHRRTAERPPSPVESRRMARRDEKCKTAMSGGPMGKRSRRERRLTTRREARCGEGPRLERGRCRWWPWSPSSASS